jgi:hypothetical protein
MNWKKRLVECLTEHQFRRGMSRGEQVKRGLEAVQGVASPLEKAKAEQTPPKKRTRKQKRDAEGARRERENIKRMLAGTRASKRTRGVSSRGKKRK